ncbi:hypothetical protein L227DRAFT_407296 [Lentinus tigrinus ALCF2SS1-6]|uniref:Uncharacterized protein n=1 Tax=Lentinus tigrinus ALCF2SS1-6 TaxID=1328759 RepID=A0A5C2SHZ0_9APHY|nr:hypothetical protein L227DRAFT_407296 [Lentinus tigrinus ALCF2SS1-6]
MGTLHGKEIQDDIQDDYIYTSPRHNTPTPINPSHPSITFQEKRSVAGGLEVVELEGCLTSLISRTGLQSYSPMEKVAICAVGMHTWHRRHHTLGICACTCIQCQKILLREGEHRSPHVIVLKHAVHHPGRPSAPSSSPSSSACLSLVISMHTLTAHLDVSRPVRTQREDSCLT